MNAAFDSPRSLRPPAAESAYLFRHSLLRDAAYQLQLPGARARLHALAFALIENSCGGRPPEPPPLDAAESPPCGPHATDSFAEELAEHAGRAGVLEGASDPAMSAARKIYLRRAAEHFGRNHESECSTRSWLALADLLPGAPKGEAIRRAGDAALKAGRPNLAEPLFKRAKDVFSEAGNRRLEGIGLAGLAAAWKDLGRVEDAERAYAEALAIHDEAADRRSRGTALANLATLHFESGRIPEAEKEFEQAIQILDEVGEQRTLGMTIGIQAGLFWKTGRMAQAEARYEQDGKESGTGPTAGC